MPEAWNRTKSLVGQLEFYWDAHLRPRLHGLGDDEYLWEPVPGCWSVRLRPDGRWTADTPPVDTRPTEHEPALFTTIAWRMAHISVGCFATRVSTFFGNGLSSATPTCSTPGTHGPRCPVRRPRRSTVMHHGGEIVVLRDLYAGTDR